MTSPDTTPGAAAAGRSPGTVDLEYPRRDVAWTYALLSGGGAGLGVVLHVLRDWLLGFEVLPWRTLVEAADRLLDGWGPWGPVALAAVGAALGALLAADEVGKEHRFEVSPERVVVVGRQGRRGFPRADVREVLHADRALVLVASNGTELVRARTGIAVDELARVFRAAGYVWDPQG